MTPSSRQTALAVSACTTAFAVLPLVQILPIDFDRTAGLLLLPALWFGRRHLRDALARFGSLSRVWIVIWLWAAAGLACSVAFSPHSAAAATTAASWVLLTAVALVAGELCATEPTANDRLMGGLAAGATLGCVAVWAWWWMSGQGRLPLYAHHRIFGLHMMIGAVATTAQVINHWERPRARNLWLAAGAVAWGGLLWAGGRAPIAAVLASLAFWWWMAGTPLRSRLAGTTAILLCGGLILSAAHWTDRPELGWWHALQRTTSVGAGGSVSVSQFTSTRSDFWRSAAGHAAERPWLGRGPDAYRFLTPKLDGQQPHNFLLQLWLDLGLIGAAPLLLLLGRRVAVGARTALAHRGLGSNAPWVALITTALLAGLLDGVFYHLLPLAGVAVALGALRPAATASSDSSRSVAVVAIGNVVLVAALGALVLHAVLFHALNVRPSPATPAGWQARLLRAWPSTTTGLPHWLDEWRRNDRPAALAWARWAQAHSVSASRFHVYAASLLLAMGDRPAAEAELRAALAKAHWSVQPAINAMLRDLGFDQPRAQP